MPTQTEIRQQITDQIIVALQSGDLPPWRKPWANDDNAPGLHTSLSTGKPYRGINQLLLQLAADKNGYKSKWWGTFKQIIDNGACVRRGERATKVILWKPVTRQRTNKRGQEVEEMIPILRQFSIFNAEQTDGLEQFQVGFAQSEQNATERYDRAEDVIDATGADIRVGGNVAAYDPRHDIIVLPHRHQFTSPADFYEVAFHELVHWSERPERLNWDRSQIENAYAMGELVAEMGACFIGNELGIPNSDSANHVAYLKNWLKAMHDDPKFIFKASSQASKAADYILSFSRSEVEEPAIIV